jgi:hypothetical protein
MSAVFNLICVADDLSGSKIITPRSVVSRGHFFSTLGEPCRAGTGVGRVTERIGWRFSRCRVARTEF